MKGEGVRLGGAWFSHSRFVPARVRDEVGDRLDGCLDMARLLCGQWPATGNCLLLSGSLARREPAVVQQPDGTWDLASDFDFGAVVGDGEIDESQIVGSVLDGLREAFPDISFSMFVVPSAGLRHVRSYFGRDLLLGAVRPVWGTLTPDHRFLPAMPPITLRSRLEVIVHQLSNVLLHGLIGWDRGGRNRDGLPAQRTKIAAEALRALLPAPRRACLRYGAVVELPDRLPVSHEHTTAVVRDRELGTGQVTPEMVQDVLVDSLRILLRVPAGPSWDTDLVQSLGAALGRSGSVMDLYQYLVLGLSVAPSLGSGARAALVRGMAESAVQHGTAVTGRAEHTHGGSLADGLRSFDGEPSAALLAELAGVRRTYYGLLGPHNFGVATIPAYDDLVLPEPGRSAEQ